jgi:hypothetical protein
MSRLPLVMNFTNNPGLALAFRWVERRFRVHGRLMPGVTGSVCGESDGQDRLFELRHDFPVIAIHEGK